MKYTLTYKNKQGVEARLDIITFGSTSTTETIEGTDTPFILNYKREKNDKEGYIISSSADIAIYESGTFNIDTLKTSNETDIKVEYYIDNVLTWSGFVVPDFFSRVIGTPAIVNMVASDRLGSLKGQTLSGLPAMVTLSSLVSSCLSKTGLSLPINLKADFTSVVGNENVFASKVISQRFTDTKGRNISCYDILRSILVMTNSVVVQRNGQWYIANKIQIEQGTALPTTQYIDFDEVSVGARRQIMPVASSVGVYHEFGGERKHPQNFDFSEALNGWTAVNGFIAQVNNKEIIGFNYENNAITPIYGTNDTLPYLLSVNTNPANHLYNNVETGWNFEDAPYLKATFPIISMNENIVNINFDTSVIGIFHSYYYFVVIAKNKNDSEDIYALNQSGLFTQYDFHSSDFLLSILLGSGENTYVNGSKNISGKFEAENVTDYDIELRIYPATLLKPGSYTGSITVAINFASVTFNNETEIPKGNIYKTTQGDNFTKVHETDTTVIGDYRTSGLNGYGYPYPIDDTSSILTSTGLLTERWTAPDNADKLPILQHVTRQRAKMFSIAHDLLTAEIDSDVLDPLATFRDCSGKKYVMVSGSQDFLRGTINVEIEEIAYSTTIWKQDYIYSYFGEGEEGISSVGGISESAPSAGGGGMTPEQLEILNNLSSWWKYDEVNDAIYSELSVYSKKEVSAYGLGESGGGTGVTALSELVDVDLASLEVGNILVYNGTHWVNLPQSAIVPDLSDYAKKTYVDTSIASLVESAPSTLDTLNELAAALGDDPNFATTVTNMIAGKENAIVAGNVSQYWRGDKTWQTLNTSVVPESGNLYFTNARVKAYADTLYLPLSGNAVSATKLQTARAFSITGAATAAAVNFDGTANVALNVTSLSAGNLTGTIPSSVLGNSMLYVGTTAIPLNRASTWQDLTGITSMQIGSASASAKLMYDAAKNAVYVVGSDGTTAVNFYATGEVSAYGAGTGGGSISYSRLDAWADYTSDKSGWVLSALLGNDLNSRVTSLEGGSATSISVTGSGNAVTNVSKSGNTLTFTKGLTFSESNHNHDGVYLKTETDPIFSAHTVKNIVNGVGFLKNSNGTWGYDNSTYSLSSHNHSGVYEPLITKSTGYLYYTGSAWSFKNESYSLSTHNHSGVYQTLDADLTSIAGLTGTSGFLKKIGVNSWELDTNSYALASHTHTFASLTSKPTTLAGYGITDAAISFGNRTNTATKTIDFITQLANWGMFNYGHSFCKFSWSYDRNADLTDTGFGTIETAGAICETWQNGDGTKMLRLICPNTGAGAYQELIYNDQGSGYSPGWRKVWNSRTLVNISQLVNDVGYITASASITGNAATATKLQTARTIWGQSFDGTGNIDGALTSVTDITASGTIQSLYGKFTNLSANYLPKQSSSGLVNSIIYDNGTNVGIGTTSPKATFQIGSGGSTIAGSKLNVVGDSVTDFTSFGNVYEVNNYDIASFGTRDGNGKVTAIKLLVMDSSPTTYGARIAILSPAVSGGSYATLKFMVGSGVGSDVMNLLSNGNVGIGTTSPAYKLDVNGTGRFTSSLTAQSLTLSGALSGATTIAASTSVTTPKHDLGNGWAMVASGSEMQMQYNGVTKMRFLSDGSFVAVGEVTAYS